MNPNTAKLKSNIRKFNIFWVLSKIFFAVPIMVLFRQDNGLNLTQIMLLQSIYAIMVVILEIPTGYFADVYGRKKTLIISAIGLSLSIIGYSISYDFWHFLLAELLFGVATSFASGTNSAFVYDTLQELGQSDRYKKVWGNSIFYSMIALALANILGGFIGRIDLRYALYASIPFFILMIPVALSFHEPDRHKLIFDKGYLPKLRDILKTSVFNNKQLKRLIIYSGIIYAFFQGALRLYQPYFTITGLNIAYFGIVFASFQVVAAISSKYSHIIEAKLGKKKSLTMLAILVIGSYFLMSNIVGLFSFVFCFLHQFIRGFKQTVITDYLNKLTLSDMRATVLSIESMFGRLIYALIIPIIGWLADVYSLLQALQIIARTSLIIFVLLLVILRRHRIV